MPVLAIGGVELVAFIVALSVFLTLLAGWVFFKAFGAVTGGGFSIFGWNPVTSITDFLGDAMKSVVGVFSAQADAVAHWLWAYGVGLWHLAYQIVSGIEDAKRWAVQGVSSAVTGLQTSVDHADALFSQAQTDLRNGLTVTEEHVGDVLTIASALFNTAEADIVRVANADADAAVSVAVSYANTLYDQAVTRIDTLKGELVADINTTSAYAATLYDEAVTRIDTLKGELVTDIAGALGTAETYADAVAKAAAGVAAAGVLAQVLPQVFSVTADIAECVEPLCDTITPNAGVLGKLGQFLTGLEALGVVALLFELVDQAVTNPQGAASDLDELGGLVTSVAGGMASVVGL